MIAILPILPGRLAVNGRFTSQHDRNGSPTGRLILSKTYRAALDEAALHVRQACLKQGWRKTGKPVRVRVATFWPDYARRGDVDSTCKGALDSLVDGSAIMDDSIVIELVATVAVDRERPRIEITVEALED